MANSQPRHTRRDLARAAAALALAPAFHRLPAAAQSATPSAGGCEPTPEMTAGPYWLPGMPVRRDITGGRPGLPLALSLRIAAADGCAPLAGAAVDVWHCDAAGVYSGVEGNTGTFLRGVQVADAAGCVRFETIFPGWYPGRTTHIHVMVRSGGEERDGAWSGGEPIFVGQLFFDEDLTARVAALPPYASRDDAQRTRNEQDRIFMREPDRARLIVAVSDVATPTAGASDALTASADIAIPAG